MLAGSQASVELKIRMSAPGLGRKTLLSLLLTLFVCASLQRPVFGQTEKLGIVQYAPPKGWTKTTKENVVAFGEFNPATGRFCIITLHGARPGTGDAESDFKREWDNLVVKPLKAEANPKTETAETAEGWTLIAGGAGVEVEGGKAAAFLTVISGGGKTVSILGVFNDASYASQLAAFSGSIELGKAGAEAAPAPRAQSTPRAQPSDIATMHAAELVKEFETNEVRANQAYAGKRVRVHGTVNNIEVEKDGRIVLTFKS
jgi:tRNA_anti-like